MYCLCSNVVSVKRYRFWMKPRSYYSNHSPLDGMLPRVSSSLLFLMSSSFIPICKIKNAPHITCKVTDNLTVCAVVILIYLVNTRMINKSHRPRERERESSWCYLRPTCCGGCVGSPVSYNEQCITCDCQISAHFVISKDKSHVKPKQRENPC